MVGISYSANANLEVSSLELQNISGYGISCSGSGTRYFSGITAVTNIGGNYGIYSASMTSGSFTVTGNSRFTSCGVFCSASGAVPIQVTNIEIRNAKNHGLNTVSGSGTITIDRVNINGATGRGISVTSQNTVLIYNSDIRNCSNSGIYLSGSGNKEISNTTIYGNTTSYYGGGVYLTEGTLTMNSCTISSNTADGGDGGGVYFSSTGYFTMNGGTISDNIATGVYGGGVHIPNGTFIMRSGTISGNSLIPQRINGGNAFGGGVYAQENVIIEGGSIYGNSIVYNNLGSGDFAKNAFGGGICCIHGGNLTMSGGTIYGNTVINNNGGSAIGGGVATAHITKTGGTIYGNNGGGNSNTCVSPTNIYGHAVYQSTSNNRNTTLGPSDNLSW
jgi:hypothetical protein